MYGQNAGMGEAAPPRWLGVFQPSAHSRQQRLRRGVRVEQPGVGYVELHGEVRRHRLDLLHGRRAGVEQRQAGLASHVLHLRRVI
jgi:hypothetical protein